MSCLGDGAALVPRMAWHLYRGWLAARDVADLVLLETPPSTLPRAHIIVGFHK